MLELRDLVKHYHTAGEETVRAVDGVSLSVSAGRDGRPIWAERLG